MNIHERTHISPHIEKTGGNSVLEVYEQIYKRSNILVYDPTTGFLDRRPDIVISRARSPLITRIKEILVKTRLYPFLAKINSQTFPNRPGNITIAQLPNLEDISVIHGHFAADTFDDVIENPFYTVVFREPLNRMISHFHHYKRSGYEFGGRVPIHKKSLLFTDFSFLPQLRNFQSSVLCGKDISDPTIFPVVGTTENLDLFVNNLTTYLGVYKDNLTVPKFNKNPIKRINRDALGITPEFEHAFREFHSEDYLNYQITQERQNQSSTIYFTTS